MYNEKIYFKNTFIFELINKNTKILLLKQKKNTKFLTLSCHKFKEKIVYYAFFY